jgi:hypothetical protein
MDELVLDVSYRRNQMRRHDAREAPSARMSAVLPTCCQAWAAEQTRPWTRRPAADCAPAEPTRPNGARAEYLVQPDWTEAT